MNRLVKLVVHNWHLKLAAIGLASVLYAGLVVSQDAQDFTGQLPIRVENQSRNLFLIEDPPPVTSIRYFAPEGAATPGPLTFRPFIDLGSLPDRGGSYVVPVQVTSTNPDLRILSVTPSTVEVRLDPITVKTVPVSIDFGTPPENVEIGKQTPLPSTVLVTGPNSTIQQVVAVRATVVIQPSGLNVDQDVALVPIDAVGNAIDLVAVEPSTARISIDVFTERDSRSLPIHPVLTGTPAAGFELASVTVQPQAELVEGDADPLAELAALDTVPISISGQSETQVIETELALPEGIGRLTDEIITVTVTFRPITESRSFTAGLGMVGARADLVYDLGVDRVLLVIGGSPPDLDGLVAADGPVATVDVTGLAPGTYDLTVSADLADGLTLVAATPPTVSVTIEPAASSPSPTAGAAP
jgi:YbbR domain-containing protein